MVQGIFRYLERRDSRVWQKDGQTNQQTFSWQLPRLTTRTLHGQKSDRNTTSCASRRFHKVTCGVVKCRGYAAMSMIDPQTPKPLPSGDIEDPLGKSYVVWTACSKAQPSRLLLERTPSNIHPATVISSRWHTCRNWLLYRTSYMPTALLGAINWHHVHVHVECVKHVSEMSSLFVSGFFDHCTLI